MKLRVEQPRNESRHPCRTAIPCAEMTLRQFRVAATGAGYASSPLRHQRQDVALVRRHAAVQRIEINLLHRCPPTALRHRDAAVEHRNEPRPRLAEPGFDAARAP